MYEACFYIVAFTIYSMVGWLIDTVYTRIYEGRWAKRGFHHGPFYMLYGWGALVSILLFTEESPLFVVIPAAILYSCAIEYGASVLFEKIGLSYWDYRRNILNLHGRICLQSISIFVAGIVLIVYAVQPLIREWLSGVPEALLNTIGIISFLYLVVWGLVRMAIQYRFHLQHGVIRSQAYDIEEK